MLGWSRLSGLLQASAQDGGGWEVWTPECGQCSERDGRTEGLGRGGDVRGFHVTLPYSRLKVQFSCQLMIRPYANPFFLPDFGSLIWTMGSTSLLLLILLGSGLSFRAWKHGEGIGGDIGLDWRHVSGFGLGTDEVENEKSREV